MARFVISFLAVVSVAYAVDCDTWSAWQPLGEAYAFQNMQLVDELRERECRAGNESWNEIMSRSRSLSAEPLYLVYGDTATGPRVVGLRGGETAGSAERLLDEAGGPLLVLVTPRAAERYAELLVGRVYLVVSREGVMLDQDGELSIEALADALAAFVIQTPF